MEGVVHEKMNCKENIDTAVEAKKRRNERKEIRVKMKE